MGFQAISAGNYFSLALKSDGTLLAWDARLDRMLVRNKGGNVTCYVYGLGLIGQEQNGTYQNYHFDSRGSTVAMTDAKGVVTDRFEYDSYGESLSHNGTSDTPFQYNGRFGVQTDPNGLLYMRARYDNPAIRRFVNQDVLFGDLNPGVSLNRFAYANGNPVSLMDPFGLCASGAVDDFGRTPSDIGPSVQAFSQGLRGEGTVGLLYHATPIPNLVQGFSDLSYFIQNGQPPPPPTLQDYAKGLANAFGGPNAAEDFGRLIPGIILGSVLPAAGLEAVGGTTAAETTTLSLDTATTWGRADTLADHFARHGADFGAQTADEYANMASQFLQDSQRAGLPTKIDSQGVIRVFDPQTGTFGAFNPNGTTRTFFKPPNPAAYFNRQPGTLLP